MRKLPNLTQMECAIVNFFNLRKTIVIPRVVGCFNHELDICAIRRNTQYCIEVEIKRSVSDMRADLKKSHTHTDPQIVELYYAFPTCILEKCMELVPPHAGVFEIKHSREYYWRAQLIRKAKRTKALPLPKEKIDYLIYNALYKLWDYKFKLRKHGL